MDIRKLKEKIFESLENAERKDTGTPACDLGTSFKKLRHISTDTMSHTEIALQFIMTYYDDESYMGFDELALSLYSILFAAELDLQKSKLQYQ